MSHPELSQKIIERIINFLQDDPKTLRACRLLSKSWASSAWKYLFPKVSFDTPDHIETWKKTFPDPSKSPGHHTQHLIIRCPQAFTEADAAENGWIQHFPRIMFLELVPGFDGGLGKDFASFQKFSSTLKYLSIRSFPFPMQKVFNLVRSLPLLEGLILQGWPGNYPDDERTVDPASISPPFTGTLELFLWGGIESIASKLLDLSGGLHFKGLVLWNTGPEDPRHITKLVEACADTLEYLELVCTKKGGPGGINLSKALKLEKVKFCTLSPRLDWIVETLDTIACGHKGFEKISFDGDSLNKRFKGNGELGSAALDKFLANFRIKQPTLDADNFKKRHRVRGGSLEQTLDDIREGYVQIARYLWMQEQAAEENFDTEKLPLEFWEVSHIPVHFELKILAKEDIKKYVGMEKLSIRLFPLSAGKRIPTIRK